MGVPCIFYKIIAGKIRGKERGEKKEVTKKYFLTSFSLVPETKRVFGRLSIFSELLDLGNGKCLLFGLSPISCADSLRPRALAWKHIGIRINWKVHAINKSVIIKTTIFFPDSNSLLMNSRMVSLNETLKRAYPISSETKRGGGGGAPNEDFACCLIYKKSLYKVIKKGVTDLKES